MTPDIEKVLETYLRSSALAELTDDGDRIRFKTPRTTDEPWIRINLIDDRPVPGSRALHLLSALVQLDCYGGSSAGSAHEEASALARTARSVLHVMDEAEHEGAVVTACQVGGIHRELDRQMKPPRERMIFDATIYFHATPA